MKNYFDDPEKEAHRKAWIVYRVTNGLENEIAESISYDYLNNDRYENTDTFRFAKASETEAVLAYEIKRRQGCCGTVDRVIFDDVGNAWLVGFNYGH